MRLQGWRIVQSHLAKTAFDGAGARRFGGRWNHQGTSLVCTASSMSLAALELLVHLQSSEILKRYVYIPVEFDDSLCVRLDPASLPPNWRNSPPLIRTRDIGSDWVNRRSSVILAVPSVVVSAEWNFLLNPKHPDFGKVAIGTPQRFKYDPRLARG